MNKEEQENREFEKLKEIGVKLHIPVVETFLTLEVFDKDGNPVCPKCSSPIPKDKEVCPNCATEAKYHQRGHSWTRNAYNLLFSQLAMKDGDDSTFGAGKLSIKDTGGTIRYGDYPISMHYFYTHDGGSADLGCIALAGDDTRGIVVGTGTTAESFEDYALDTAIADGVAATQLSYIASNAPVITYTAGTKVLKTDLLRYFNNNSGGSIVVAEVGLITRDCVSQGFREWLQARDVLGATVTVADTGQMKAIYTIQLTYPS